MRGLIGFMACLVASSSLIDWGAHSTGPDRAAFFLMGVFFALGCLSFAAGRPQ